MTRLLALATTALLAGAWSAQAADAIQRAFEPVPVAPASTFDWSGPYAGLHAGYGWGDRDWNGTTLFGVPVPDELYQYDMGGLLLGAQIGYNWQRDRLVFGVEADAAWTDIDDELTETFIATTDSEVQVEWFATVRGRVGYAWDRILLYGTGGVAFAGVETDVTLLGLSDSASGTHVGWTVGLGAETMMTERLGVKLEYLYADFGDEPYDYSLLGLPGDDTVGSAELQLHTIRLGVNFHF